MSGDEAASQQSKVTASRSRRRGVVLRRRGKKTTPKGKREREEKESKTWKGKDKDRKGTAAAFFSSSLPVRSVCHFLFLAFSVFYSCPCFPFRLVGASVITPLLFFLFLPLRDGCCFCFLQPQRKRRHTTRKKHTLLIWDRQLAAAWGRPLRRPRRQVDRGPATRFPN